MLLSSVDRGLNWDTVGIAGLLLNAGNPARGLEREPGNSKRSCILVPTIDAEPISWNVGTWAFQVAWASLQHAFTGFKREHP